jgi:LCP family protein required for cell wall assembly
MTKSKKVLLISSGVFLLFLIAGGGYVWYLYSKIEDSMQSMYEPLETPGNATGNPSKDVKPLPVPVDQSWEKPLATLLIGVDQRKNDPGRADTIMIAVFHPMDRTLRLLNIPRDTRTQIIGTGKEDKINHAYAFGGVRMVKQTVEHFLGVEIPYYMKVNMEEFSSIIDEIDGVSVDNPTEFTYGKLHFPVGSIHLNGAEALAYSRMRNEDPLGDLGRNARQRRVIRGIIDRLASPYFFKLPGVLDDVSRTVKTNLTTDMLKDLVRSRQFHIRSVETIQIEGLGKKIDDIYYYVVSEQERQRVNGIVQTWMKEEQ